MDLITDPKDLQEQCWAWRGKHSIALTPTMGSFHDAHLSLMAWAKENADKTVVSLFVNPTQFGPNEDLEAYPRNFEKDMELAKGQGVNILFAPTPEKMYSPDHAAWVNVDCLAENLCGKSRPGHFQGVATVVTKLLLLAIPDVAVFGQKDWQQLVIIRKLVQDLNIPTRIEGRPIVREEDGLAMSSRNVYLTRAERRQAPNIHKALLSISECVSTGIISADELLKKFRKRMARNVSSGVIDYAEIVHPETLKPLARVEDKALMAVAVKLGRAKLLDNILLTAHSA